MYDTIESNEGSLNCAGTDSSGVTMVTGRKSTGMGWRLRKCMAGPIPRINPGDGTLMFQRFVESNSNEIHDALLEADVENQTVCGSGCLLTAV